MKRLPAVLFFLLIALISCCRVTHAPSTPDFPVCAGSRPPVMLGEALSFCGYSGIISCCDAADDAALHDQFQQMNAVSDAECVAAVKATLCAIKCSPFLSAAGESTTRSLPLRCESPPSPPQQQDYGSGATMCVERITAAGSYRGMAAHPDGSGRAFLFTMDGKIWPASVPARGSGAVLRVGDSALLDLKDRVHYDAARGFGLIGVAFHPGFATNGRFFVSYTCDSGRSQAFGAGRRCSSSSANGSSTPCPYQLVVAEFSANGGHDRSKTRAEPSEVRTIFTMGLSHSSYNRHGGQILFRPAASGDGHLYLIAGQHDGDDGPLSKDNMSYGKIIRFDVDRSTPKIEQPEIFAMGLSNPMGCSFDSQMPWYLYCANADEQQGEGVYLISDEASGNNSASCAKTAIYLVIAHSGLAGAGRVPPIVGGIVYQGSADPQLKGRYLYMYGFTAWAAAAESKGRYAAARIPSISCSGNTPVPCRGDGGKAIRGSVLSFSEDASNDAFILATDGVYRLVEPGLCGGAPPLPEPPRSASAGLNVWLLLFQAFVLLCAFSMIWSTICGGGGQVETRCTDCCGGSINCCVNVTNNEPGTARSGA